MRSNGLAAVRVPETDRYGYIDREGRLVIEPIFRLALPFSDGFAVVVEPEGDDVTAQYLIREDGTRASLSSKFERFRPFSEGLSAVSVDGTWGYIDTAGEIAIAPAYSHAGAFSGGLAYVTGLPGSADGGHHGYIDVSGSLAFHLDYEIDNARPFSEGRAVVIITPQTLSETYSMGYVDENGEYVVEPKYRVATNFENGLAWVESDEWSGYIDRRGRRFWSKDSSR